jgi:hypothetical protein
MSASPELIDYYVPSKGDWLTEPNRILQPWQNDPHRLFSWLEMLHFSALPFVWLGRHLRDIRHDCLIASMMVPGDKPIFNMSAPLDEKAIERGIKLLEEVQKTTRGIGLQISADTTHELIEQLKKTSELLHRQNLQWLSDQVEGIEKLVRKELIQRDFFYVTPERVKYFPRINQPPIFGDAVAGAFPGAAYDIQEAAMCMGLARPTAAAMHAVRALEPALLAVAREAGFSPKRDEWGGIIDEIEKRMDPKNQLYIQDRTKREFLSPAAAQFRYFKDAWRNHAMHGREKFTEQEAERVYSAVRSFMMYLAEKGLKE